MLPMTNDKVLLAMSGTAEPSAMALRRWLKKRDIALDVETLPFGIMRHTLETGAARDRSAIAVLTPWDFAPELDWRSGFPEAVPDPDAILN